MKELFNNFKTKTKIQKVSLIMAIIGITLLITGVSFAFFNANFLGIRENKLTIGKNLIFRYDETGTALSLSNDDILSDEDGKNQSKYFDFEVSQQTEEETTTNYYIYLTKDESSNLSDEKVKIYLTDQSNNKLQDLSNISQLAQHETFENSYYLYGTSITSNEGIKVTDNYRLRVWVVDSYNPIITEQDGVHTLEKQDTSYKFTVGIATGEMPEKIKCDPMPEDESGANSPSVSLASNMIPVCYNSENDVWLKADSTNTDSDYRWYSYSGKTWANVVTVTEVESTRDDLVDAEVGTVIPMERINTMWVWIPRFTATGDTANYNGGTKSAPGAFNITFVDKDTSAHDAFTFGSDPISGFWMGKFETTGSVSSACTNSSCNVSSVTILPNRASLVSQSVSSYFYMSRSMETSGNVYGFDKTVDTTLDTHMLKNNEWGAVAYLTQSIYGRCTSSTSCTEVGINNNSSLVTGYGAPAGSGTSVTNGAYNTSLGMNASTTGNIYGVYDMSGGAWEYVMGNYNNTIGSSQFTTLPNTKYYNVYTTSSAYTTAGLQHALTETRKWYGDSALFVNSSVPWFLRGGYYSHSSYAGVFHFNDNTGNSDTDCDSRFSAVIN